MILVKNVQFLLKKKQFWVGLIFLLSLLMFNLAVYFNNLAEIAANQDSYQGFSAKIAAVLPLQAKVILGSYPDPYFYLINNRPDLMMQTVPNSPATEPIDVDVYNQIFARNDYIVLSYFLNRHVYNYVQQNAQEILLNTTQSKGYKVWVIKFKPLAERQVLTLPASEQWHYPEL